MFETLKSVLWWLVIDLILLVNAAMICGIVKDSFVRGYKDCMKVKEDFLKSLGSVETKSRNVGLN